MYGKPPYTVEDLMSVANQFGVTEDLLHRMTYVPDSLENYNM